MIVCSICKNYLREIVYFGSEYLLEYMLQNLFLTKISWYYNDPYILPDAIIKTSVLLKVKDEKKESFSVRKEKRNKLSSFKL